MISQNPPDVSSAPNTHTTEVPPPVIPPTAQKRPHSTHLPASQPVSPPVSNPVSRAVSPIVEHDSKRIKHEHNSISLRDKQLNCLENAVVELGGPYWDRILELHGTNGLRSESLGGLKEYHLWNMASQQYAEHMDNDQIVPTWLKLASKSMYGESEQLREKEVIEASYVAHNWSSSEDEFIIRQLQELKAPEWDKVYARFVEQFSNTKWTQTDIEHRAVILHRYYTFFSQLAPPEGLEYIRTVHLNSFGLPVSPEWTELEDSRLLEGLQKVKGSGWNKILSMYGPSGSVGNELASKTESDLAKRAREWSVVAAGPHKTRLSPEILEVVQFIRAKGFTESGLPVSRGWNDELDRLLLSELNMLKAPTYNEIINRHGTNGRISEKLAPKNYGQLRMRALKLYEFCISEGKPLPPGLQYAKRKHN